MGKHPESGQAIRVLSLPIEDGLGNIMIGENDMTGREAPK